MACLLDFSIFIPLVAKTRLNVFLAHRAHPQKASAISTKSKCQILFTWVFSTNYYVAILLEISYLVKSLARPLPGQNKLTS